MFYNGPKIRRIVEPLIEEWYNLVNSKIDSLRKDIKADVERDVRYVYAQIIDDLKVDARHLLNRTDKEVAAKLSEMEAPRYDWTQLAESMIRRLNSIETQLVKIREQQAQHEQTFKALGWELQKAADNGASIGTRAQSDGRCWSCGGMDPECPDCRPKT